MVQRLEAAAVGDSSSRIDFGLCFTCCERLENFIRRWLHSMANCACNGIWNRQIAYTLWYIFTYILHIVYLFIYIPIYVFWANVLCRSDTLTVQRKRLHSCPLCLFFLSFGRDRHACDKWRRRRRHTRSQCRPVLFNVHSHIIPSNKSTTGIFSLLISFYLHSFSICICCCGHLTWYIIIDTSAQRTNEKKKKIWIKPNILSRDWYS